MENQVINPGLLLTRNGDRAVQLTTAGKLKTIHSGLKDLSTVDQMFEFSQDRMHLGLLYTFDALGSRMQRNNTIPRIMLDMLEKRAVINLEDGYNSFTYSTHIQHYDGLKIMKTTTAAECSEKPGLGDSAFPVHLNKPLRQGDVITYDIEMGIQIAVSEEYDIIPNADMYTHYMKITQGSGDFYFPLDKLTAGTEYFKVTHTMGEFSEDYSEFMYDYTTEELMQEFNLGNHLGVSVGTTLYGGERATAAMTAETKRIFDKIESDMNMFRSSTNRLYDSLLLIDNFTAGSVLQTDGSLALSGQNTTVMSLFEAMVLAEVIRLETTQILWAKEGLLIEINGHKRINEGLYTQMRRGNIFTYPIPGSTDLSFWQRVSDSVFRHNLNMPVSDRRMTWTVGKALAENLDFIKQNHGVAMLLTQPYQMLLGTDRPLPQSPVRGTLDNLTIDQIRIGSVFLPGVGMLDYRHDPSLDFSAGQDRHATKLYHNSGRSRGTYSGYLDVKDTSMTNVFTDPNLRNASFADDGALMSSSVFYVKPRRSLHWGWEQGRMNTVSHLEERLSHLSSVKSMTSEFWVHTRSAGFIPDKSAIFMVELERPKLTII